MPQPPDLSALISQGTQALRHASYAEAVSAFQKAADLAPGSVLPHTYLGIAWLQQYVSGVRSPENALYRDRAEAEFSRSLEADPTDWNSLVMLGSVAFREQQLGEARSLFERALEVKPADPGVWYTLGVIAWQQWQQDRTAAARSILDRGVLDLNKALSLDPEHQDAMQYLALFLRDRARFSQNGDARNQDAVAAEDLLRRSRTLKSKKTQAETTRVLELHHAGVGGPDAMLQEWVRMAVQPAPPPPPPPITEPRENGSQDAPVLRFDPSHQFKR